MPLYRHWGLGFEDPEHGLGTVLAGNGRAGRGRHLGCPDLPVPGVRVSDRRLQGGVYLSELAALVQYLAKSGKTLVYRALSAKRFW